MKGAREVIEVQALAALGWEAYEKRVLQIPGRAAPRLAALGSKGTAEDVRRILAEEVQRVLDDTVAEYLRRRAS